MRHLPLLLIFPLLLGLLACGTEPTDRPQDCRENQWFDEAQRRCRTCPAVEEPECRPGCETEVFRDQRNCPVLRCQEICEGDDGNDTA